VPGQCRNGARRARASAAAALQSGSAATAGGHARPATAAISSAPARAPNTAACLCGAGREAAQRSARLPATVAPDANTRRAERRFRAPTARKSNGAPRAHASSPPAADGADEEQAAGGARRQLGGARAGRRGPRTARAERR
jgi:hypothetical protein